MQYLAQKILGSIQDKKIILFGTGNVSKIISSQAPLAISYYIDNDSKKWNSTFMGAVIHGPERLKKENKDRIAIFIASSYNEQIALQLKALGYKEGIHFWDGMVLFKEIVNEAISEKGPEVVQLLKKNAALKNVHRNKRCFVIGNGPSIAKQNLILLKDDIKIVVSSFYRHPQMEELHPEYWVVSDPQFWLKPDNTLYPLLDTLESKRFKTKFFIPSAGGSLLTEKANAGVNIDPHVFHYNLNLTSIEDIDFSKDVPPWGQNVIISALMLAFYLGCNNIYLIGCDHDWWGYTKEKYVEDCSRFTHFYQNSTELKVKTIAEQFTYEGLQKTIVNQRTQYELLKEYGDKKSQHVYNATVGGLLDIFPRVQYESLF